MRSCAKTPRALPQRSDRLGPEPIFSDARLSPSFFFTTPAKKPRTECGCQPVTFMIAAIVAPSWERSKLRTRSCLEVPMRERETRAEFCLVLKLARFETLERERGFAFDRVIGTSEMGDTIVAPPRPRQASYPRGPVLRRSAAASVTDSNAPIPREVQQNMSNLVAQLPLSWAVAKSALLDLSRTSTTKRQDIPSAPGDAFG